MISSALPRRRRRSERKTRSTRRKKRACARGRKNGGRPGSPRGTERALLARSMRYPRNMHKCIAVSQMQADTGSDPSARQHRPPLFAAPVQRGVPLPTSSPPVLCIALSNAPNRSEGSRRVSLRKRAFT